MGAVGAGVHACPLEGTDGMDRMLGKGGDDRIDGGKGRDLL